MNICSDEVGLIEFEFEGDPVLLEVHVFQTRTFSGEMTETEEMRPQWWEEAQVRVTTAVLPLVNNSYSPPGAVHSDVAG